MKHYLYLLALAPTLVIGSEIECPEKTKKICGFDVTENLRVCNCSIKDSIAVLTLADGEVVEKKSSIKHGPQKKWFRDGKVAETGYFKEGCRDGKWIGWHHNGSIYFKGTYANCGKTGIWFYKDKNGNITDEREYVKGGYQYP